VCVCEHEHLVEVKTHNTHTHTRNKQEKKNKKKIKINNLYFFSIFSSTNLVLFWINKSILVLWMGFEHWLCKNKQEQKKTKIPQTRSQKWFWLLLTFLFGKGQLLQNHTTYTSHHSHSLVTLWNPIPLPLTIYIVIPLSLSFMQHQIIIKLICQ
jgi:hypothetical protein